VYCGVIRGFFGADAPITVVWEQNVISDTKIQWCWLGCSNSTFTLTLSADGQSLTSQVVIFNPVQHLTVTFKKIGDGPKPLLAQPPPCNLTDLKVVTNRDQIQDVTVCPYKAKLQAQSSDSSDQYPSKTSGDSYQYCYVLNHALNLSLSWTYVSDPTSSDGGYLSAMISGPATTAQYVALGFMPTFPGMIDADIALGYLDANQNQCVQSLYAAAYVGTPISNPLMTLTSPSVNYQDGRVNVAFTRAVNTGHHNITSPQPPSAQTPFTIMWSIGPAPKDCVSPPSYHGSSTRGVRVVDWEVPSAIFGDYMKC